MVAFIGALITQQLKQPLILGYILTGLTLLGIAAVKAICFLLVMVLVGTRMIPSSMKYIANWNSRELFLLATVLMGLAIGQSEIRSRTKATIAGILREGTLYSNPAPDFVLASQDVVGVLGQTDQLALFREMS